MNDRSRLIATTVIWIAFAIMTSTLLTSVTGAVAKAGDAALFGIVLVLTIGAITGTLAIWTTGGSSANATQTAAAHAELAKRKRANRERIERLIDGMDDDDIYDLEALLLARDQADLHAKQD